MLKHGATKPDGHKRFVWPCCLSDTIFPLDPIVASLDVRSASADPHVSCWPPALVLLTSDNEGSAVAVRSRSLSRSFAAGLDDPAVAEPARRGQDRSTGDHPSVAPRGLQGILALEVAKEGGAAKDRSCPAWSHPHAHEEFQIKPYGCKSGCLGGSVWTTVSVPSSATSTIRTGSCARDDTSFAAALAVCSEADSKAVLGLSQQTLNLGIRFLLSD